MVGEALGMAVDGGTEGTVVVGTVDGETLGMAVGALLSSLDGLLEGSTVVGNRLGEAVGSSLSCGCNDGLADGIQAFLVEERIHLAGKGRTGGVFADH